MNTSNESSAALAVEELQWSPDLWVVLWSGNQHALHIEPLGDTLRKNLAALAENRSTDYVPVFIGSRAQVDEAAEKIRPDVPKEPPSLRERLEGVANELCAPLGHKASLQTNGDSDSFTLAVPGFREVQITGLEARTNSGPSRCMNFMRAKLRIAGVEG